MFSFCCWRQAEKNRYARHEAAGVCAISDCTDSLQSKTHVLFFKHSLFYCAFSVIMLSNSHDTIEMLGLHRGTPALFDIWSNNPSVFNRTTELSC